MTDKVLVIYTGGTIGMVPNDTGALTPSKNVFYEYILCHDQLHDKSYCGESDNEKSTVLVLPDNNGRKVFYEIDEWENPIDSTNITIGEWVKMAKQIQENYDKYRGFVILHGTDTMTYTAAALSMMLDGLDKPVVITGAQIPIFDECTDGVHNFKSSLIVAGTMYIPEVSLLFDNVLLRGNRAAKISNRSVTAFQSPNCEPFATLDININMNYSPSLLFNKKDKLTVCPMKEHHTAIIYFYPGIELDSIKKSLEEPTKGAILVTYGNGNLPTTTKELHHELKKASQRGVILVNVTQCLHGGVEAIYETGEILQNCNVLPGCDMTIEAAYVKLLHVLSNDDWDVDEKRRIMAMNLRGELTPNNNINN